MACLGIDQNAPHVAVWRTPHLLCLDDVVAHVVQAFPRRTELRLDAKAGARRVMVQITIDDAGELMAAWGFSLYSSMRIRTWKMAGIGLAPAPPIE